MAKEKTIQLTIDGKKCKVPEGSTLLQAARNQDINIPVICLHDATTPEGLCRQCVVEVEGWGRLAPSCITPVEDGMVVFTESERVVRTRRTILEMLNASVDLSNSPQLNAQMERYGADPKRFPGAKKREQIGGSGVVWRGTGPVHSTFPLNPLMGDALEWWR